MPGTIVSYDAGKGTAVITPGYARVYSDGSTTDTKNIVDCPVFVLQGGGIHIGLPIKKDDECLVIFGDADIDAWFENGGQPAPISSRMHSLSDGFALVGLRSLKKQQVWLSALTSDEGGLADDTMKVALNQVTKKITISKGAENLAQILSDLIDTTKAITVAGVRIDASWITALDAIKTRVGGFLS
jgi:hypothetical protein